MLEIIDYLQSEDFKSEFAPFVKNNDIFIKLLCLHVSLITNSIINGSMDSTAMPIVQSFKFSYDLRKSTFLLNSGRFPSRFMSLLYHKFHSHLPEELFYDDFVKFYRKNYSAINKFIHNAVRKGVDDEKMGERLTKMIDDEDFVIYRKSEVENDIKSNISNKLEEDDDFDAQNSDELHPLVGKLVIYTQAHLKYLKTLSINDIATKKVHWGLRKVQKIEDSSSK